jgi:hypothetical protein
MRKCKRFLIWPGIWAASLCSLLRRLSVNHLMNKEFLALLATAVVCQAQTNIVVDKTAVPATPPVTVVAYAISSAESQKLSLTNLVLECNDEDWLACSDVKVAGKDPEYWKAEQLVKDGKKYEVLSVILKPDALKDGEKDGILIDLKGSRKQVKVTLPAQFVQKLLARSTGSP